MERIGRGTTPESGLVLQKRLDGGDGWSIHRTFVGSRVLVATAARIAHWKRERLIPAEMFRPMPQEGGALLCRLPVRETPRMRRARRYSDLRRRCALLCRRAQGEQEMHGGALWGCHLL